MMIYVEFKPSNFASVVTTELHGGKAVYVKISPEVIDAINWVNTYRAQLDKEIALRNSNPALAIQWDHYQTLLRIVMDDV